MNAQTKQKQTTGQISAISLLIEDNVDYAKKLAKELFSHKSYLPLSLEDLEGAAILGLCEAAHRYDPTSGVHFRGYCYFRVKGSMLDHIRENSFLPRKYFSDLAQATGEEKELMEIEYELQSKTSMYQSDIFEQLGYDLHFVKDDRSAVISYVHSKDSETVMLLKEKQDRIADALVTLSQDERDVLFFKYFTDKTFAEIQELMDGVSKSWVSRAHRSAIDKLKLYLSTTDIGDDLKVGDEYASLEA